MHVNHRRGDSVRRYRNRLRRWTSHWHPLGPGDRRLCRQKYRAKVRAALHGDPEGEALPMWRFRAWWP